MNVEYSSVNIALLPKIRLNFLKLNANQIQVASLMSLILQLLSSKVENVITLKGILIRGVNIVIVMKPRTTILKLLLHPSN